MFAEPIRIGVCTIAREQSGSEHAKSISSRIMRSLKILESERIFSFPKSISDPSLSREAAQYFLGKSIDLLLIINGTYASAQCIVNLVQHLGVPLII